MMKYAQREFGSTDVRTATVCGTVDLLAVASRTAKATLLTSKQCHVLAF